MKRTSCIRFLGVAINVFSCIGLANPAISASEFAEIPACRLMYGDQVFAYSFENGFVFDESNLKIGQFDLTGQIFSTNNAWNPVARLRPDGVVVERGRPTDREVLKVDGDGNIFYSIKPDDLVATVSCNSEFPRKIAEAGLAYLGLYQRGRVTGSNTGSLPLELARRESFRDAKNKCMKRKFEGDVTVLSGSCFGGFDQGYSCAGAFLCR